MRIIDIGENRIAIETPYNPLFVKKIKAFDSRWDADKKQWITDSRNIKAVRQIMKDVYGMDDQPTKLVTVSVRLSEALYGKRTSVTLFGRVVATAWGRDSGARVGEKVAFLKNQPKSGGSVKNWMTVVPEGSEILIHDLAETAVVEGLDWDDSYGTCEIVNPVNPIAIDREALKKEKAQLMARLEEVETLLASN